MILDRICEYFTLPIFSIYLQSMEIGGGGGWKTPPYLVDFSDPVPFRVKDEQFGLLVWL